MPNTNPTLLDVYSKLNLADANEAETRLKLIDAVIFGPLGWMSDDVSVEEHCNEDGDSGYIDYILRTATSSVIIEAKRVGSAIFDFPEKRTFQLGSLKSKSSYKYIVQAREYARKKGVQFAVITNGNQWLVYPAVRIDGINFSKSSAIYFPSLSSALEVDFIEFKTLLSRQGVIDGGPSLHLLGRVQDQFHERRLRHSFSNTGRIVGENPLYPFLDKAVQKAFSHTALENDFSLLEKCYVKDGDRTKFDRQINMHLKRMDPPADIRAQRPMQKSAQSEAAKRLLDRLPERSRPLALLVLGQVGAGKTTFLHFTRHVSARHIFTPPTNSPYYAHWIYIDFRDFLPTESPDTFMHERILNYFEQDSFFSDFEKCVRPAYRQSLDHKKRTVWKPISNDQEELNRRISDFLEQEIKSKRYVDTLLTYAAKKSDVVIVIDNVDQIEDQESQSNIFSNAIAFSNRTHTNFVAVLRDATYVQHKSSALFDAFDMDAIYIDPPPVVMVLSRRFNLLEHELQGRSATFTAENGARVEVGDLSSLVSLFRESILGTRIGTIINALSSGDIRLGLRMTRQFLESGYSNPGRAIENLKQKRKYIMPKHEALRALLLGRQSAYQEETSLIGNPFDSHLDVTNLQALRIFIVSALVQRATKADFNGVIGDNMKKALSTIGVDEASSLSVVADLVSFRYIRTAGHERPSFDASFFPTRLSGYVCRNLIADFTFLEAMMMDTFISDGDTWNELRRLSEEIEEERDIVRRLDLRSERCERFYVFLNNSYKPLQEQALNHRLKGEWCVNPYDEMEKRLKENLNKARKSARRNYKKTS